MHCATPTMLSILLGEMHCLLLLSLFPSLYGVYHAMPLYCKKAAAVGEWPHARILALSLTARDTHYSRIHTLKNWE